jgi:pimeloyl-ACP methyl ester carboxylesterase
MYELKRFHGSAPASRLFLCGWQIYKHHGEHISKRQWQHLIYQTGNTTAQYKIGQIYVERLTPPAVLQQYPLVFIAGAGQTGTNFLETPDGRPGWASFFLDQGYVVYLSDQASRGRSPWNPSVGSMMTTSTASVEEIFTATSRHSNWPQSKLHTQWPGTGVVGDSIFDAFYASQIQFIRETNIYEMQNTEAYSALLDKIGTAHLVTHSQAGTYGWRIGDARPNLVKSIVALEPSGPPFEGKAPSLGDRPWGITVQEITYNPTAGPNATFLEKMTVPAKDTEHYDCILQREPARKLKNLSGIPVLVVTGEASFHAPYDYCTVEYLKQAGVQVEHVNLAEEGIHGNGHMFFMEKNNMQIAERVLKWLMAL